MQLLNYRTLKKFFPTIKRNIPLSRYTTFKIGGKAKYFFIVRDEETLKKAVFISRESQIPLFVLGSGSNILFPDNGFNGLVVKNEIRYLRIIHSPIAEFSIPKIKKSFVQTKPASKNLRALSFQGLDYEEKGEPVFLEVSSGVLLGHLINFSLIRGLTGLQWFVGIPGTVGGAVFFNVHGGTRYISDYLVSAEIMKKTGKVQRVKNSYFKFSYDESSLRKTGDIVLSVVLRLFKGDVEKAKFVAREWLLRKLKVQPRKNNPGSIFRNLQLSKRKMKEVIKRGLEITPEMERSGVIPAGWLIDKMGFRGKKLGRVQVSRKHANFIVNLGGGRAGDVKKLINLIKERAKEKFALELKEEVLLI